MLIGNISTGEGVSFGITDNHQFKNELMFKVEFVVHVNALR
jgi:hypothetical protein